MQEKHSVPLPVPGEQGQPRAVWDTGVPGRMGKLPGEPSPLTQPVLNYSKNSSMAMFAKLQTFPPDIRRKGTLGGWGRGRGVLKHKLPVCTVFR